MDSEWSFRIALAGLIVLFLPVGVYHRLKAATGEPLRRRDEGNFVMIALRLSGLFGMMAILTYLFDPRLMRWSQVALPAGLRWVGLPLGLMAEAWTFWMFRSLGANLTDTVTVREHATLVTHGPYRWVRHPLYLGVLLIMLASSLLTANALILSFGIVAVALLIVRSGTEEAKLEDRFGAPYLAYRSRTGFLFPKLRSSR